MNYNNHLKPKPKSNLYSESFSKTPIASPTSHYKPYERSISKPYTNFNKSSVHKQEITRNLMTDFNKNTLDLNTINDFNNK